MDLRISTDFIRCPRCESEYDPPDDWQGRVFWEGVRFMSKCDTCDIEHEVTVLSLFVSGPIESEASDE